MSQSASGRLAILLLGAVLQLAGNTPCALAADSANAPVVSACNEQNAPGRSPGPQFEMFYDIQRPEHLADLDIDTYSPSDVYPLVGKPRWRSDTLRRESVSWRPSPIWPNLVDPARFDRKKLSGTGGFIYYYEPDGKGGRRICRVEEWRSRDPAQYQAIGAPSSAQPHQGHQADSRQTHNPVLAELARAYIPLRATQFLYNTAGQIRVVGDFEEKNWQAPGTIDGYVVGPDWEAVDHACYLWRPDDQLERYAPYCSRRGKMYVTSTYFEYRYAADGAPAGTVVHAPFQSHVSPDAWTETWYLKVNNSEIEAGANSEDGVLYITGAGILAPKDNNDFNWQDDDVNIDGQYAFPDKVPLSLLEQLDTIYNYRRVRETGAGLMRVRVLEVFPAGSSQATDRLWLNLDNNRVVRQEQYRNGKLWRVINIDLESIKRNWAFDEKHRLRYGKYYEEHLDGYPIRPQDLKHRVYEYDAAGKEKLVAVSWTKFSAVPANSSREMSYYGLPDGAVKWKDFEAFRKAFDIQETVDWLYPKGRPERF